MTLIDELYLNFPPRLIKPRIYFSDAAEQEDWFKIKYNFNEKWKKWNEIPNKLFFKYANFHFFDCRELVEIFPKVLELACNLIRNKIKSARYEYVVNNGVYIFMFRIVRLDLYEIIFNTDQQKLIVKIFDKYYEKYNGMDLSYKFWRENGYYKDVYYDYDPEIGDYLKKSYHYERRESLEKLTDYLKNKSQMS